MQPANVTALSLNFDSAYSQIEMEVLKYTSLAHYVVMVVKELYK